MKICVTAEDIEKGTPRSCCRCPVASAIRRVTGDQGYTVGLLMVHHHGGLPIQVLPDAVRVWIQAFDEDRELVEPFEFEMAL